MIESILDHRILSERIFFPRRAGLPNPFLVDCGEAKLACYYHEINPESKTLVHFHGNGEVVADYIPEFISLVEQMGCNCFLADYRGYGMSTGTPSLVKMLSDAEKIINSIPRDPETMVLFGRSLGSIYAIHCAHRFPQIPGLIIESGIADPLDRVLFRVTPDELNTTMDTIKAAVDRDLDHQKKLSQFKGATLIMHSRFDGLLDVAHGEKLHAWAPEPKKLKIFENGDHNSIMYVNYQEYFHLVSQFIHAL